MDGQGQNEASDSSPLTSMTSRAYQIEMFEQSMKENIIVTMDTGSGKTQIARLRIEAELERTPTKLTWFSAPSVVLARQQHLFLSSQLPAHNFRLIIGEDNPSYWSGQHVWDKVLDGINTVVSTPQVLLEALSNGFVKLQNISLLVFDEAHHCIGQNPLAQIMQLHYHPLRQYSTKNAVPSILGLTATAITNSPKKLQELESNMNASCRRPTRHLEEYEAHVHMPCLERLTYSRSQSSSSALLQNLTTVVGALVIEDDPRTKWLQSNRTPQADSKLEKIKRLGYTPVMKEMRSFLGHVTEIESAVGIWAAAVYARACISKLHDLVRERDSMFMDLSEDEQQYMLRKLSGVMPAIAPTDSPAIDTTAVAHKSQVLIEYLLRECTSQSTVIVFVKRRSVAWTLAQLLQMYPALERLGVFCFIGTATFRKQNLVDLVDVQVQKAAFADFQVGKRNICITTPVMEEGIDVQAVNLVVRFDQPENLRSHIQARGRARQADSKLVIVDEDDSTLEKVKKWNMIENDMKAYYEDEQRLIAEWRRMEDDDVGCPGEYRVPTTNAVLTYNNARQHLDHFCSTLPRIAHNKPAEPIIRISGIVGEHMSARVQLPSSVPPLLQVTDSVHKWRSAKAAIKDAAFHCYRALHTAGAVNDHLLPFPKATDHDNMSQARDSTYAVRQAVNPWQRRIHRATRLSHLKAYRIEIRGTITEFPPLLCLIPAAVDHIPPFTLWATPFGDLSVKINPYQAGLDIPMDTAFQINQVLLKLVLGRRLKGQSLDDDVPFLLLPEGDDDLEGWFQRVSQDEIPLTGLAINSNLTGHTYLLRHEQEEMLYRWIPEFNGCESLSLNPDTKIRAQRLTRDLQFLNAKNIGSTPIERELLVGECHLQQLPAAYGELMLFVPSISRMLGLAIRAQMSLEESPIRGIGFKNRSHIQEAFTSAAASPTHNYDRLEFLGDAILKYHASVQVFFQDIHLPESVLTSKRGVLINNARLQKVARDLGLDSYITVEAFSGRDWTLLPLESSHETRELSSKTLADVIEALLGAAFLDVEDSGHTDETRVIAALSTFLPEVQWRQPKDHVNAFTLQRQSLLPNTERLARVESLIGYEFKIKNLLGEALTKTSLRPGVPSYERLEFLGDAVLDRIVSVELYQRCPASDSESLTARHHALVNHRFLTFLSLSLSQQVTQHEITCPGPDQEVITQNAKTMRLVDHVGNIPDRTQIAQRKRAEKTFLENRADIEHALTVGKSFPWTLLHAIDSSKMYSDVIESLLAAVYIDSGGDLAVCTKFLEKIGLMQVLRRLTAAEEVVGGNHSSSSNDDVETNAPWPLLRIRQPSVKIERKALGSISKDNKRWKCSLSIGDEMLAVAESQVSQAHADCLAAEAAHKVLDTRSDVESTEAV